MTHIYIKPSSNQRSTTSREASAAGRLRPNAVTGNLGTSSGVPLFVQSDDPLTAVETVVSGMKFVSI